MTNSETMGGSMAVAASDQNDEIMQVRGLVKHFPITSGLMNRPTGSIRAVDGIDLTIRRGETLGLVGESGCGKTTLGRTLVRLYEPTAGSITFDGKDIGALNEKQLRAMRRQLQIIYQDPYASLNPRMSVEDIIGEPLLVHRIGDKQSRSERVLELLNLVGLAPEHRSRYPHEFSGGQRQRIGIARALAAGPEFVVCDEAVSALDVSIQAQVLNLLEELKKRLGLTYLFISHDLGVIRHVCDRVAVMYLGRIVEFADCEKLFENPIHPYTKALLSAIPVPDPTVERTRTRLTLSGDLPSPANPPTGCHFHTRCPQRQDDCASMSQSLREVEPNHWVACQYWDLPDPELSAAASAVN